MSISVQLPARMNAQNPWSASISPHGASFSSLLPQSMSGLSTPSTGYYTDTEEVVTSSHAAQPWEGSIPFHQDIRPGSMVFMQRRIRGNKSRGDQELMTTLQNVNFLLRQFWDTAMAHIERVRSTPPEMHTASQREMLSYLQKPEALWSPLFAMDKPANIDLAILRYLCKEGIVRQWQFFGHCYAPGSPVDRDNGIKRPGVSKLISLVHQGAHIIENVWGGRGGSNASTMILLKRDRLPKSPDRFGPFQFIPYPNVTTDVPPETITEYRGVADYREYAHVWRMGTVMDPLNSPVDPLQLPQIRGSIGTRQQCNEAAALCGKVKVLLKAPVMMQ